MKRLFDFLFSLLGLVVASPVLLVVTLAVWLQDRHSPFYIAPRVGKGERTFQMVKLRSMVVHADRSGIDSTSADDVRITPVGSFIRRYKLDEFSQLWNVLKGDMSVVGPRPNVLAEVELYTKDERRLLRARPGITDLSSIVFSDESEILEGAHDPDLAYNQLIRPWKSRLGLLYLDNASFWLDLKIIVITMLAIVNRQSALQHVQSIIQRLGADGELVEISGRKVALYPYPPPGTTEVVAAR